MRGKGQPARQVARMSAATCGTDPDVAALIRATAALTPRPQFQAFQSGSNADADLALHAQGLQRDRIGGAADQHIAADADAEGRTALRADVIAGEVARPEP